MRPLRDSLPMGLLRARESAMARFRPVLARFDVTEQQWRVLRVLSGADTSLEVGEIAARTFLLAPSLSRILAHLESRGLVARDAAEHDQRIALISLTDDGRHLVEAIAPQSEAIYNEIERAFGADRLARLLCELRDLESELTR